MDRQKIQNYFKYSTQDLANRKVRVWHAIERGMAQESEVVVIERFGNWGFKPLAISTMMLLFVGMAISNYGQVLPGSKLYSVKRSVEKAQLALAVDAEAKEEVQVKIVETRVAEVSQLEEKLSTKVQPTANDKAALEQVKLEIGKAALQIAAATTTPVVKEVPKTPADVAAATVASAVQADPLFQIAEAKAVGEAVTQFLYSTKLTGKQKTEALKQVVVQAKEVYLAEAISKETATPSDVKPSIPETKPTLTEPTKPTETPSTETEEPEDSQAQ